MTPEETIIQRVNEVLDRARTIWPQFASCRNPEISFYTVGKTAGKAYGYCILKFNLHIFKQNEDDMLSDTVPHEVAHMVCAYLPQLGKGHNPGWKRVCKMLGGTGKRCYDSSEVNALAARHRKRYKHVATCGTEIWVPDISHKKIMKGVSFTMRKTGGKLSQTTFTGLVK